MEIQEKSLGIFCPNPNKDYYLPPLIKKLLESQKGIYWRNNEWNLLEYLAKATKVILEGLE